MLRLVAPRRSTRDLIGAAIGLGLGVLGALLTYGDAPGWFGFPIAGLVIGPLFGWIGGLSLFAPLHRARYNPLRKTLRLRFRHPGYARLMAEAIDGRDS